ncbi:MAG: hypothetical protein AAFX99_16810 [Myxococcota bacterium]
MCDTLRHTSTAMFLDRDIVHLEGTLDFDPRDLSGAQGAPWWLIVRTQDEPRRYCAWWVETVYGVRLQRPRWGSHISVIRGLQPPPRRRQDWGKRNGERVVFTAALDGLTCHRGTWWLPVRCPRLERVRIELGLDPTPTIPLHWTLGREMIP